MTRYCAEPDDGKRRTADRVKRIRLDDVPAPNGHYSQASRFDDLLFISGQLPDASVGPAPDFEAQVRSVMGKILAIVRGAGGRPDDLLKVTAYIVDVGNWPKFDRIFAEMLGDVRPARAVVPVPELHYGFLVEIEAIAALAAETGGG